jgi:hypothetical protein
MGWTAFAVVSAMIGMASVVFLYRELRKAERALDAERKQSADDFAFIAKEMEQYLARMNRAESEVRRTRDKSSWRKWAN